MAGNQVGFNDLGTHLPRIFEIPSPPAQRGDAYGQLLARLTTTYDIRARLLFLNTISPEPASSIT